MNDETIKKPDMQQRMWDIVRALDYGRFAGSWFKSISIQGNLVVLTVSYEMIPYLVNELSEYIQTNYVLEMLESQYPNFKVPEGFDFAFIFGPYKFLIVKSTDQY